MKGNQAKEWNCMELCIAAKSNKIIKGILKNPQNKTEIRLMILNNRQD